jgi:hypothetical protein
VLSQAPEGLTSKPCKGLKKSFSKRTFLPSVKTLPKNIPITFSRVLGKISKRFDGNV